MVDAEKIQQIIAECAEKHLVPYFKNLKDDQIKEKTALTDIVTQADVEMEENLIRRLKEAYPDASCFGEESFDPTNTAVLEAPLLFVIDPLDGTNAFRNGLHGFAVLVCQLENGKPVRGWLHAPLLGEKIYVEKGKGVFLNGTKITPKKISTIQDQMGTGHFAVHNNAEALAMTSRLEEAGLKLTFHTHACMDFLGFAKGEVDFIFYGNCYPWDILVGVLIAHELGGQTGLIHDQKDVMDKPFADINQATLYARRKQDWSAIRQILLSS